jgi:protoporphyrinogen oxidase
MAWLWARLSCRTSELGTYQGGFARFASDAGNALIASGVKVKTSNAVRYLTAHAGKWRLRTSQHESTDDFDDVVFCCSPFVIRDILKNSELSLPNFVSGEGEQTSLGAQVVVMSLRKKLGDHYWYSLQKSKKFPFLALIEHTNFVNPSHFSGEHIVYLADYVDPNSSDWLRTDEELINLAKGTCNLVNQTLVEADFREAWVFREKYAQPVPKVGHSQKVPPFDVLSQSGQTKTGLYMATMGHVYPWDRGTNFALELGQRVAAHALGT